MKKIIHASKGQPKTMLAIEADVTIKAGMDGEDGQKSSPSFDVTAYTGGAIQLAGWDLPTVIDLDGMGFSNNLVANLDHDRSKRVGHITAKSKEGGQLVFSGIASAETSSRNEVVASAANGFTWQASIEARADKISELSAGKMRKVNGQDITGPAYIVSKSTLTGFAFVSHGADDNTSASIAATADSKEKDMDPKFVKWVKAMLPRLNLETADAELIEDLEAQYEGLETPKPTRRLDEVFADRKANEERKTRITELAADSMDQYPHQIEAIRDLADTHIDKGSTPEQFELALYRATMPQGHRPSGTVRDQFGSATGEVIEAAMCLTNNLPDVEKHYKEQTLDAADRFRGIGLQQMLLMGAAANGYRLHPGERLNEGNLRSVLKAAFREPDIRAAGFSTLSIPTILSNVMNKFVRDAFNAVDGTALRIASRRPVNDFKAITSFSLTGDLQYEELGPTGQIKHGTAGEETYSNQAKTYARMLAITRQDIINDDTGALMAVPRRLGRGGATKLNDVFWTVFLNNSSFFAAGNNNVSTGGGSALGADGSGIDAAEIVFMNQTDPDGLPLGLMPVILLVPPTLKTNALIATRSQEVVTGADLTRGSTNIFAGRFRVESSPYMENSAYTGYSAAAWYLLADPMDMPVMEIALLNGREMPVVETAEADFDTLGIQTRGYHDFGCALQEPRGGVRSAGS